MSSSLRNYQLPGNRTAYAFSDAAGSNACIAMYEWNKENQPEAGLFSNRHHYPESYRVKVHPGCPDLAAKSFDCLFTGTSHAASGDHFELSCLQEAKKNHIHSISFVDHWLNFRHRFTDAGGSVVLPDEIWVVDERARSLAREEGLPEERIKVTGNPYHAYLQYKWRSRWEGKRYLSSLGIKEEGYHILFAPDPLSLRNRQEAVGFHEGEALRSILKTIARFDDGHILLIVKSHPLQPAGVLENEINLAGLANVFFVKEADTLELLNTADIVIGIYSNVLLDAWALHKEVVRYYPGREQADLLGHNTTLVKLEDETALYDHLKKIIYG